MKRANRLFLILITGFIGFLALIVGPGMLAGAGGPEAANLMRILGVLAFVVMARLSWVDVQERRVAADSRDDK